MRSIWVAPMLALAWSCGGQVGSSPVSVAGDASVDALPVADSSMDALWDSEASGAESEIASCALSGDGSFGSETSYTMGPDPCWIVAADFNGDGVSDLAVVNGGSTNGVTVMLSQCR